MSLRSLGGPVLGGVVIPCIPATDLITTITAAKAANTISTTVIGMLVKFTFANNDEVDQADTGEPFDGVIEDVIEDNINTWIVSVRALRFSDKSGNRHPVHSVGEYLYTGSPALQDAVVVDTTAAMTVKPATTYGDGAVLSIDTTNKLVKVLMD